MKDLCDPYTKSYNLHQNILKDLNVTLNKKAMILDFGCGAGNLVKTYEEHGYKNAYGFDIIDYWNPKLSKEKFIFSPQSIQQYENTFDFAYSHVVFEHVMDYPATIARLHSFLKPGGVSLHFFPSKYTFIEEHVKVPFGSVIQNRFYFTFWHYLGFRSKRPKGSIREFVENELKFCREHLNYLNGSQIRALFGEKFEEVRFVENLLLKHSFKKLKYITTPIKSLPFMPFLMRNFRMRAIFLRKLLT